MNSLSVVFGIGKNAMSTGRDHPSLTFGIFVQIQEFGKPPMLIFQHSSLLEYSKKLFLSFQLFLEELLGQYIPDLFGITDSMVHAGDNHIVNVAL